jgi:hypothetical protein
MTITHHRIKTFAGWEVQQPFPGIYLWRDPFGALYLVDHTGTRRLRGSDEQTATSRVETWFSRITLDWAA